MKTGICTSIPGESTQPSTPTSPTLAAGSANSLSRNLISQPTAAVSACHGWIPYAGKLPRQRRHRFPIALPRRVHHTAGDPRRFHFSDHLADRFPEFSALQVVVGIEKHAANLPCAQDSPQGVIRRHSFA
jgi:hypothetical protein